MNAFSKHSQGANGNAKKPIIRRETVVVSKSKTSSGASLQPGSSSTAAKPSGNRFQLSARHGSKTAPPKKPQAPAQRAIAAASRGMKRKSTTPERVHFSSDSESDSSDEGASDSDISRKRLKSSVSSIESSGPKRPLILEAAFADKTEQLGFLEGADATSGEYEAKFKNPWNQEEFSTVELQYPSNTARERFELKWPKNEKDDYKPMEDILETIKQICAFYLPKDLGEKYCSDEGGFARRFNRAWQRQSIPEFISLVDEFNSMLKPLIDDGTIRKELTTKQQLPLDLVRRILDQIYSRTVSPKVETLRAYQNGSDNVYGELLARFCSSIFHQTKMNRDHVFVDLGSGVGNVVLQAALEVGCESWGIEMMKNPCDLAELQAREFPPRAHLWGLDVGEVKLIRGDLTKDVEIPKILQRADIILVNNQAFTPRLNDILLSMFLDLKDGAQVVSLKPFVHEGHKISMRNISSPANLLVQQRFEYFSGSVSWTDQSGYYYIATKDPRPLEEFHKQHAGR